METVNVFCINDGKSYDIPAGTRLKDFAKKAYPSSTKDSGNPILAALVDHKLKELEFKIINPVEVEFIGYSHPDGRRTWIRSLCFVLQKAVRELYPDETLIIDYALPSGLYCEIRLKEKYEDGRNIVHKIEDSEIKILKERIREMVRQDIPFTTRKLTSEQAVKIFEDNGQPDKARLLRSLGRYTSSVYFLDDTADTFYGPLVPSTGYLKNFAISGFKEGFCLQYPMEGDNHKLAPMKRQAKIAATLKSHSDWCAIIGVRGIGTLNEAIRTGNAINIINLAEARHERRYAEIADMIYNKRDKVKIVFIAGPSSSGKTSTSLRLANQCKVLGLNPKVIELDNYFVNREDTPKDENGEYDFEALEAMDLQLLNRQLNDLLEGKTIEIPKFNFKMGQRESSGKTMKLEEKDILIMEGIHALNPDMTSAVDNSRIFRVYASALTSLSIDENNNISTSDNRLLRRMVRDNRTRGISPEDTILRWHSVRRGENHNIFPFQENADTEFNSALIFELPMLKYYAEPLLRRIAPNSPAYTEAVRMLKFLDYIIALSPDEIAAIPPTSIMREFIGGQTL